MRGARRYGHKGRRSVFARSYESAEARVRSDEGGSCRTGGTVVGRGPVSWLTVVVDRPENRDMERTAHQLGRGITEPTPSIFRKCRDLQAVCSLATLPT